MTLRHLSRRDMLRGTAAAALSLAGGQSLADQTALERRQPVGLKLACSSLAFTDLTWEAALAEIKKLGFRFADLAMLEGWSEKHPSPSTLTDPEGHGKKIATVCEQLDVEPIAIHASFVLGDRKQFPGLTTPDPAARKAILSQFERLVTCARKAEIPLINVQPGNPIEGVAAEMCRKNAVEMLTQMHAMAARRGLVLSFENSTGSIAQHPDDALSILDKVPGLRLDYNPSHVVRNEISLGETQPLMKHVAHVGLRNAKLGGPNPPTSNGGLSYPIRPFLEAFRRENVNAYVSVECLEPATSGNIPALKSMLEREGIPST